ncbi:MAG: hypothetical protein U9N30_00160 [Campylobacterota bacterium]|nr:hypothetical protein [Campylobacterota bacterium]
MNQHQLNEARTNPDFLNYLDQTQKDAMETKDIAALYEVLDSLLVLDLIDENRINIVYEEILKIAFDKVEEFIGQNKKLTLKDDALYYIRAFYEHAIEKWSMDNFKGAKELFFILAQIIDDAKLIDALNIHIITCANQIDMDTFYETSVNVDALNTDETYGYFIINFNFETNTFLEQNHKILATQYNELKHLLDT